MAHLLRRYAALVTVSSLIAGAVVFLACTGDDPVLTGAADADAGDTGTGAVDEAGVDSAARPCDPAGAFGIPVVVEGLANKDFTEQAAHFTADERTVVFNNYGIDGGVIIVDGGVSTENFYGDIYTSTRATTAEPFGPATTIVSLVSADIETGPSTTGDGQTIYFVHLAAAAGSTVPTIWTAERNPMGGTFDFFNPAPLPAPVNEGDGGQTSVYVLNDGTALYFTSTRGGRPGFYRAARVKGVLSGVQPVPGLTASAGQNLGSVAVTPDELTIYYSSSPASGNADIYVATRKDTSSPFSGVRAMKELNTPLDESPSYVSADGCRLYYTSTNFVVDGDGGVFVTYKSDVLMTSKAK
jgi:hypothetical protein